MEKTLSEITRQEWIAFNWIEVESSFGVDDRTFMAEQRRTPNEAYQAAIDWDSTIEEREEMKEVKL